MTEVAAAAAGGRRSVGVSSHFVSGATAGRPFLRVPPFPGRRLLQFREIAAANDCAWPDIVQDLRKFRVGGTYWGSQPRLPARYLVLRSSEALEASQQLMPGQPRILWEVADELTAAPMATVVADDCDPWHMLASASAVVVEPDDELRLIAAVLGVDCYLYGRLTNEIRQTFDDPAALLFRALGGTIFENPFSGEPMSPRGAIDLCSFWRELIDSNRDIDGGIGFAFWKQNHIAPLLWNGTNEFRFLRNPAEVRPGSSVAVWRAKAPQRAIAQLERSNGSLIEIEDGFLRSRGLGADCIPPLSITVDRLGAYFDPSQPSQLEQILQEGSIDANLINRARELRRLIVEAGIGKYEQGGRSIARPARERRHILVPGQVEDDRAVQLGGCGLVSNVELLSRVREEAPDAYILYKAHPDVLAGHRRGAVADRDCLQFADEIVGQVPIASMIEMVDEVHVNTSLAGFEALLRGKEVTTYGVPFYAGWGLTRDLGPVPQRRTAKRTIDELVAATLLLYPRYFDPVTGLPCPAEVVVARLSVIETGDAGFVVSMRRLQGKFMRRLRSLVQ